MSVNIEGISYLWNPTWVILAGLLAVLYWAFIYESRVDRMLKKFPGYRDYPIVGHAYMFFNPEDTMKVIDGWMKQYGKRCRVYFGSSLKLLILSDPVDFEKVATSTELLEKSAFYDSLKDWLGDGLLISRVGRITPTPLARKLDTCLKNVMQDRDIFGQKWFTHRKLLTRAFHFKILENFQPIFDEHSKALVSLLKNSKDNKVEIQALFTRCTLDVVCETAMGKKLNSLMDENNEYLKATIRESEILWMRWTKPWLQNALIWKLTKFCEEEKATRKILHSFTAEVIKEKKANSDGKIAELLQESNDDDQNVYFSAKKRFAFLDLLLHIQATGEHELTDRNIQEETDTFMFAGHDTTATTLSWTTYLLGLHPSHQEKVHEELKAIFGDDKSRPVESADLTKLKYLEMCIKESLRIYPIVPLFSRAVPQDFKLDEHSIIPKGAIVAFNTYSAHRDPDNFPQPEEYRPERFSPENISKRHPFAFIPFSAGPRNCIGQKFALTEVKTILANLFRNFQVQSMESPENVKAMPELILRAKNGIWVKLTPR